MSPLTLAVKAGLYALMFFSFIAAAGVVTLKNLFHAALCLVFVLLGTAGIFLSLGAEFLAVVQILLYVGAVMTIVIFVIMLTHRIGDKSIEQSNRQSVPALMAVTALFSLIAGGILKANWPAGRITPVSETNTADLGAALMGPYVFPFEVISVILIAVLIGAIVVARKEKA